ncbi:hypothetical protein DB88DRAFT_547313 [Papiliotrema laurentii]|uniref:T6SS Phospholipase effector Tle1-like catalytic domain-containing protein n=1 Tax=Papiliotrema laurentii TaxID=5418 RepID=A0AAD9CXB0_PAPLA|nr:hypothetical protein DB88DRAFT_547313 [Papiliotrema laurentii]
MPKNIVVLLDGTGNQFGDKNTDLIRLKSVLSESEEDQMVYYSSGLGTVLPVGTSHWGRLRRKLAQVIDMATALNFSDFVCDAYRFLVDYYKEGDNVYLFGFSRGAYVARVLAGMIQRHDPDRSCHRAILSGGVEGAAKINSRYPAQAPDPPPLDLPRAYEFYKAWKDLQDWNEAARWDEYKKIFGISRIVKIHFLGVWDTVSSLGGFGLPRLPFAAAPAVKYFRQALALDERRARFVPEYVRSDRELEKLQKIFEKSYGQRFRSKWLQEKRKLFGQRDHDDKQEQKRKSSAPAKTKPGNPAPAKTKSGSSATARTKPGNSVPTKTKPGTSVPTKTRPESSASAKTKPGNSAPAETKPKSSTTAQTRPGTSALNKTKSGSSTTASETPAERLELWFRGAHSDVGGDQCGILLNFEAVKNMIPSGISLPQGSDRVSPLVAWLATEEFPQPANMRSRPPFRDSLTLWWWPLEVIPLRTRNYTPEGVESGNKVRINLGGGRQMIPEQRIHMSVLAELGEKYTSKGFLGLSGKQRSYRPAAKVPDGWPTWDHLAGGARGDFFMI